MIRFFYNLLFPLGLLFFLPAYLVKMRRRGNYRRNFGQRFAFYDKAVRDRLAQTPHTWMHAVSVGEVAIALKLAARLRELDPTFHCALTTTTTTGYAFAEREASEGVMVLYNALDFWPLMRRAFAVIRPERIILVEAEVWPNLTAEARRRGVPIALVNARLSPRSERRFRRFRFFVAPTFRLLDLVCVQEARDVARWEALGVLPGAIQHVGSIKYDPAEVHFDNAWPRQVLQDFGIDPARLILLGGSTHAGEEEILARVFLQLRAEFPEVLLLIAPRHVERTGEIATRLRALGLRLARRSETAKGQSGDLDCLLLDTTGELRHWYAAATVVFMGKSLTTHGGQNPVEPILAGRPVVFGPHMENFATLAESLVARAAAVRVADEDGLREAVANLLRDGDRRERLVENARAVLSTHRGATMRTARLVLGLRRAPVRLS